MSETKGNILAENLTGYFSQRNKERFAKLMEKLQKRTYRPISNPERVKNILTAFSQNKK
jgi:hypothetical protein